MTKTSCTPARARPSSVQSSRGALQIGRRHWLTDSDSAQITRAKPKHLGSIGSQRLESLVETVCEDDSLKDFVRLIICLRLVCRLWRHSVWLYTDDDA